MQKRKVKWIYAMIFMFLIIADCNKDGDIIYSYLNPWFVYGSMTDLDGNIYKTIQIGDQTWMERNLKTTLYNDGAPIPIVNDKAEWNSLTTPGCCWQDNNQIFKVTYGVLYNWYAIKTGKLCPAGWHVPTDEEWTELTDFLGSENVAGGKLKETGFIHWRNPNAGATDEVAFRALPGGDRAINPDATYENLFEKGYWWTSTFVSERAISRIMNTGSISVQKSFTPMHYGLSVRCIKDP
jgi:uncharacterized protein (TIGR02145 family)